MYETHFGFHSRPFTATPDADRFFPTEATRQAFDSCVDCVERASGAALIVGASGIGKSVFLQALARRFQHDFSVAVLESASIQSRKELLQNILFELGLPFHGMEEGELRLTLMDYLKPSERCPNGLLLCVDEAHLLPVGLLEEMRMITNLVREGKPRARLVLAGSPAIEEILADPRLESLSQRISTRCYLQAMNAQECRRYMQAQLEAVGQSLESIFDEDAIDAVHVATLGIPRLVNQVCDHALVLAIADGSTRVTGRLINEAWSDIQRLPVDWNVLGAESDRKNEHVIEFGELDPVASSAELPEPDSMTESIDAAATASSFDGAADTESDPPETTGESETGTTQPEPFVFRGPRNPFEESFDQEELVVDRFSQVIGHSPKHPRKPGPQPPSPEVVSFDMDQVGSNPSSQSSDESGTEVSENQGTPAVQGDRTPTQPSGESLLGEWKPLDWHSRGSGEPEPLGENSEPAKSGPEEESSPRDPLKEYLENAGDAITFGVGQGIEADTFTSSLPSESVKPETAPDNFAKVLDSCVDPEDRMTKQIGESVADLHARVGEMVGNQPESNTTGNPSEDPSAATEGPGATRDDSDMIIIQEESAGPAGEASEGTVPLPGPNEAAGSPRVHREDYRELFDRLRNG